MRLRSRRHLHNRIERLLPEMSRAKDDLLDALHGALADEFIKRIKDGTATAADLSAARQFLKDNGVNAVPAPGSPVNNLMETLPFSAEDDQHSYN